MLEGGVLFAILAGLLLADAVTSPRPRRWILPRSQAGTAVLLLIATALFGLVLALTGAMLVSAVAVMALIAALALISNIKRAVMGEPLIFTDLAMIRAIFQHPQFYIAALLPWQTAALVAGLAGTGALLVWFSQAGIAPRLAGLGTAAGAAFGLLGLVRLRRWDDLARHADPEADVARHGLLATLLLHWWQWRGLPDPAPCRAPPIAGAGGQLVIIVQCESFTDPVALFGDPDLALPGLAAARSVAWASGRLAVSGFGANTMRTEYGVLFGRGEDLLGLRRFDPFLTAASEASFALPHRLAADEWTCTFVHPHDMRFYGRDRLMPQAGFDRLVGEDAFAPPAAAEGRYVTDAAVTEGIIDLARAAEGASLIYAVTIENHGPWPRVRDASPRSRAAPYLRLLGNSDAMLARLLETLPQLGRPAILCFFGDHRPSIPGASEPGAERHTPYVLVRFDADGTPCPGDHNDGALTPAELHHAILDAIRSGQTQAKQHPVAQAAR